MPSKANVEAVADSVTKYQVTPGDQGDAIEVEAYSVPADQRFTSLSIVTGPCSVVLVDFGGDSLVGNVGTARREGDDSRL